MTHEELLKELIAAFEEYVAAVEAARRWYSDSNLWRLDGLVGDIISRRRGG